MPIIDLLIKKVYRNIFMIEAKLLRLHSIRKNYSFKITDFGVCLPLYDAQYSISQFMGTLFFMAPEIYDKRASVEQPMYTTKIDLFSLGESILNIMGFI